MSQQPPTGLLALNPDILLEILEQLPDVESLRNAVLSCEHIYSAFQPYKNRVATKVFKNEVPEQLHKLAIICRRVMTGCYGFIDLSYTRMADGKFWDIETCFRQIAADKSRTDTMQLTPKAALASVKLFRLIRHLERMDIVKPEDRDESRAIASTFQINHVPFRIAARTEVRGIMCRETMPTSTKMQVIRAIYLWQMVASLSKNMVFTYRLPNTGEPFKYGLVSLVDRKLAFEKVKQFNSSMSRTFMNPLEALQVLNVHKCFRGVIFNYSGYVKIQDPRLRRLTSLLLAEGCNSLAFLTHKSHQSLRTSATKQINTLRDSLAGANGPRQHALSAILSAEMGLQLRPWSRIGQRQVPWYEDADALKAWGHIRVLLREISNVAAVEYFDFPERQILAIRVSFGLYLSRAYAFWTLDEWLAHAGLILSDASQTLHICTGAQAGDLDRTAVHFADLGVPFHKLASIPQNVGSSAIFDLDMA